MVGSKHLGNALIATAKRVALRDGVLAPRYNGHSNLEIKRDSKVIIDCYNNKK